MDGGAGIQRRIKEEADGRFFVSTRKRDDQRNKLIRLFDAIKRIARGAAETNKRAVARIVYFRP